MSDKKEKKRLMKQRNKKKFTRQNSHKINRVPSSWRKARGRHSNVRLKRKYAKNMPNPGYGSPKEVRGLHPSGLTDNLVHNPKDLEDLDPEADGARIGKSVGGRKAEAIMEKAEELEIHVFNGKTFEENEEEDVKSD